MYWRWRSTPRIARGCTPEPRRTRPTFSLQRSWSNEGEQHERDNVGTAFGHPEFFGIGGSEFMKMPRNTILYILTAGIGLAQAPGSGWSWQNPLPQGNPLRATAMLDAKTAVAVGDAGTILRTTDGGVTWKAVSSGATQSLLGVSFSGGKTGSA